VDFIATGQHREMFYQGLSPFGIKPTVTDDHGGKSVAGISLSKSVQDYLPCLRSRNTIWYWYTVIPQPHLAVLWLASITEFHAHMWKLGYALVT